MTFKHVMVNLDEEINQIATYKLTPTPFWAMELLEEDIPLFFILFFNYNFDHIYIQ